MNSNLEAYRIFQRVAQTNSFSGAARELFITQPAVSQAIKQLEETLGCPLFRRSSRGVSLTDEGKMLLGYIQSAMNLIDTGEDKLLKMRSLLGGELKIGAGDTITRQFLLPHINRFHTSYPDIGIRVTNRTSTELLEFLRSGQIDLAVVNLPLPEDGIQVIECAAIEDVFVAGERFGELNGREISLEELGSYPLIMLEPKSNSRRYVDRFFLSQGVTLAPEIELGAYELLIDFARIGLGLACVIREFSGAELENGSLFPILLRENIPQRHIGICHLSGIDLSPAARRFIELVMEKAERP